MPGHDWVPSTLGHGETMCRRCAITNREAAALGCLNYCEPPPRLGCEALADGAKVISLHEERLKRKSR
jgi:hypothetical protein